ncbi:hypothetical protein GCK32_001677 [Trichostrongylus colubriformis]|uniref:Uncharacterized protein n=1 Tax=Trichostrongylus colubriformis TaxID=6319 RepID=A0AAN8IE56_TRICO
MVYLIARAIAATADEFGLQRDTDNPKWRLKELEEFRRMQRSNHRPQGQKERGVDSLLRKLKDQLNVTQEKVAGGEAMKATA